MSIEARDWAWTVRCPAGVKFLLLALADVAETDLAYPSIETMMAKTCKSRRAIYYNLQELEDLGLIKKVGKPGDNGIPSQKYRLQMADCAKIAHAKIARKGCKKRRESTQKLHPNRKEPKGTGARAREAGRNGLRTRADHLWYVVQTDNEWLSSWGDPPTDDELKAAKEARGPPGSEKNGPASE